MGFDFYFASDEAERRGMAAKMRSKEGKEEYKMRKETVEWPSVISSII